MLRLLGILALGNMISGGHHHRRRLARRLGRDLLLGALLGSLAAGRSGRHVEEDLREAARSAKKSVRKAAKKVKKELRDARKAEHERRIAEHLDAVHAEIAARKAAREERLNALRAEIEAGKAQQELRRNSREPGVRDEQPDGTGEAETIRALVMDLERDARAAAASADVPTIQFPEEEEKYHSSGKYGYA